ncbi:MAG: lipopolysaccharide biosynthesis protein [Bacteroidota bacterium]
MSKFKIYLRSSGTGFISTFVSKGSAFVSVWLLNQVLSKAAYGNYEFVFSLVNILLIVGSAGLQHVAMYRLSRLDAPPEKLIGHDLAAKLVRYSILTSGFICALVVIGAPFYSDLIGKSELQFWIAGLAFLVPIKAVHGIYDSWFRARQRIAESILYYEMYPALAKVGFLCACWLMWPTVYGVVSAILLSELVPLGFRYVKAPLNILKTNADITSWDLKYAGQLAITSGVSKTVKYADVLMMGLLSTSAATAGYVIASKLSHLLLVAHSINNKIITPRIGSFLSKDDFQSIYSEYHQSRVLTLCFAMLGSIGFSVLGYFVLNIFGDYQESYSTLMILCATYVVHVSFGMSGGYLNIAGYSQLTLLTTVLVLVINIAFNYLLIPILGADGAAIAMLISFIFTNSITSTIILFKDNLKTYSIKLSIITLLFVTMLLLNAFLLITVPVSVGMLIFIFFVFLLTERDFISNFTQKLYRSLFK